MSIRWRVTEALRRLCHLVAGIAIIVAMVLTVFDVVSRKLFSFPVRGVVDVVGLCVVISTMSGIALCWSLRAHIVVDILDMTGSPRLMAFLDILTRVAGIVVSPLLMWLAYVQFRDVFEFGDRTPDLDIPLAWFWAAIIVGYALSALLLLIGPPAEGSRDA